jgi:hypothetical protein
LVLIKMKNGAECGGVAGVPWPKQYEGGKDPGKDSFIFSLGATSARFDLVDPKTPLYCTSDGFAFGCPSDLFVFTAREGCGSVGQGDYAGPRESGQLIGGTAATWFQPYERWELWRL